MCLFIINHTLLNKQCLVFCFLALISCQEKNETDFEVTSNQIAIVTPQPKTYELNYGNDTTYNAFIEGLELILDSIYLEEDLYNEKSYQCNVNFDAYFSVFDQLTIDSNWTLESHYRHFGDAGRVLLLGFEQGNAASKKMRKRLYGTFERNNDYGLSKELIDYESAINAMDGIHINPSKMGYFQFIVFHLIGTNYCNFWHSNYSELSLITSPKQLKELTELEDNFYYKFSQDQKKEILNINPEPKVELYADSATVSLVLLSPWYGFSRYKYSISKDWPHQQSIIDTDPLLIYNCGISF